MPVVMNRQDLKTQRRKSMANGGTSVPQPLCRYTLFKTHETALPTQVLITHAANRIGIRFQQANQNNRQKTTEQPEQQLADTIWGQFYTQVVAQSPRTSNQKHPISAETSRTKLQTFRYSKQSLRRHRKTSDCNKSLRTSPTTLPATYHKASSFPNKLMSRRTPRELQLETSVPLQNHFKQFWQQEAAHQEPFVFLLPHIRNVV